MKRIFLAGLLMITGFSALGARVVTITGEPILLDQKHGDYYVVGKDYVKPKHGYTYVTLEGTKRVCYTKKQRWLKASMTEIQVEMTGQAGVNPRWYCYEAVKPYFNAP